jgi:hypothetical protein
MAHIVPFKIAAARGAEDVGAGGAAGAQIVIFPGVRRERHAEAQIGQRDDQPGDAPGRDWLELPDEPTDELPDELPADHRR